MPLDEKRLFTPDGLLDADELLALAEQAALGLANVITSGTGYSYASPSGVIIIPPDPTDTAHYQAIQVNDVTQPQEPALDFLASYGLTAAGADDAAGTRTRVTYSRAVAVNAQTGTTYTVADADGGGLTTFNNASAVAVTLPQAGTAGAFASTWFADYVNLGAGLVTITPTTSTVNGAASISLATGQWLRLVSDGTNYLAEVGWTTIQVGGTAQTLRPILDLIAGSGITLTPADDGANARTKVTIATTADTDYYQTVQVGGSAQTQRGTLDLIAGTNITLTPADDGAGDRTKVTIDATGGGSGTVNAGTAGQIAYYPASAAAVSGNPNLTVSTGTLTIGQAGTQAGAVALSGGTSGTTTLQPVAAASGTLTLPAATSTLAALGVVQTWTAAQSFTDGDLVLLGGSSGSSTLKAPATGGGTVTLPAGTTTLAGLGVAETWTANQSFTDGTLILLGSSSGSATLKAPATGGGTMTLPTGTDTVCAVAATQTLSNKTLDSSCVISSTASLPSGVGGNGVTKLSEGTLNATGTTQLAAAPIVTDSVAVTPSASNTAVILPNKAGARIMIHNTSNSLGVLVFPNSGASISGNAPDASVALGTGQTQVFWRLSSTQWYVSTVS